MKYPTLPVPNSSREMLDVFRGYNHNLLIGDGEFFEMKNMTSNYYPILSPRGKRGVYATPKAPQGMIAKDSLCYVDGSNFVMDGYSIDMGLSTAEEDCPKQLISMGAYVVILPDKKWINTLDVSKFGNVEASFETTSDVTFELCTIDGEEYTGTICAPGEPEDPENMDYWIDTSSTPHTLKQYSATSGMWVSIATTYIRISSPGIGKAFQQYDGVTISGLEETGLESILGSAILYGVEEDAVIVAGLLEGTLTVEAPLTLRREMPAMDFVVESNNRLWGCRYGLNNQGRVVNELYACKLGDFKNWNCFLGISTDSYYVSLGSDGAFTGAITHAGFPLFFRENCLHKVYGQIPANFSVQTTPCRGVQKGSEKSLAIVDEILYYKSCQGICAYDGALPVEVSQALGDGTYGAAIGAGYGSRYYVSMERQGSRSLFVYDTVRGLWHKENDPGTKLLCPCREDLCCALEDGSIITLLGTGEAWEKTLPWMLETGILGGSAPEKKYLVQLSIRLSLALGSRVELYAQYDSRGSWESLGHITARELGSFTVPVKPRRCDHLRLRLEGEGDCTIYSITKTYAFSRR